MSNIDVKTVESFAAQWTSFNQSTVSPAELKTQFDAYFDTFPWECLPANPVGFDLGCGSGRWAKFVAPRVGKLHLIDAREAIIQVAKKNLNANLNCEFHVASVDQIPIPDRTMDFGYALGVFHYVPNSSEAIKSCVAKLKPNAPFLLYVYYALENRPFWYRALWRMSDVVRRGISGLPYWAKYGISSAIAGIVYWPLARLSLVLESLGLNVHSIPLSNYRKRSFYAMRTDSLDRFGSPIEHRFTKDQIRQMMGQAGLERIKFSSSVYWGAMGYKSSL